MKLFEEILHSVNDFVWGPIMLVLLVGTGVFLTIRLKFLPWRNGCGSAHCLVCPRNTQRAF